MSDVVERLRAFSHPEREEAAEEIVKLRDTSDNLREIRGVLLRSLQLQDAEIERLRARVAELEKDAARLKRGLKFYADQMHFDHQGDEWDTVSGEPESIWCHEDGNSTVEDGAVARRTLEGWDLPDNPDAEGMIPPVAQQEGEV